MSYALSNRLAPFRNRDFRMFFLAQTLSMVGTWSHDLARSWIIVSATGSSGALGNLNMAIAVPCLFLILQGGVLVDRTDVRRLIQRTKALMGVSSLILAALSEFSHLHVWQLMIFGLVEGMIVSFDSPAFQALTVRMVPRGDFQQAIALNSTNFHTSRTLGPIVAAWLMAWHGPSLVFLFDGITYFVVAGVLTLMSLRHVPRTVAFQSRRHSLREGLHYVRTHPSLRYRVAELMLAIACIYPMMVAIFRVYITEKFKLDAAAFGTVFSFPALGSMAGALIYAVIKPNKPGHGVYLGVPLVFTMLVLIPFLSELRLAVAAMTAAGFGLYLTFNSLTISMQLAVAEEFRGRLSSVIGLGFSALGPLTCFPWGHWADRIGAPTAIWSAAGIFGLGSALLAMANRRKTYAPVDAIAERL